MCLTTHICYLIALIYVCMYQVAQSAVSRKLFVRETKKENIVLKWSKEDRGN